MVCCSGDMSRTSVDTTSCPPAMAHSCHSTQPQGKSQVHPYKQALAHRHRQTPADTGRHRQTPADTGTKPTRHDPKRCRPVPFLTRAHTTARTHRQTRASRLRNRPHKGYRGRQSVGVVHNAARHTLRDRARRDGRGGQPRTENSDTYSSSVMPGQRLPGVRSSQPAPPVIRTAATPCAPRAPDTRCHTRCSSGSRNTDCSVLPSIHVAYPPAVRLCMMPRPSTNTSAKKRKQRRLHNKPTHEHTQAHPYTPSGSGQAYGPT
jgi:hypothetical protein